MDITEITIDRECATELRNCVYSLYDTFAAARKISEREGSGIDMIGLNTKVVPVFNSAFTFLVSRNRKICRDEGLLHTGCKVGLTLGESLKYLQLPDVDVVEVRFNALLVFGALLFTLFLVEIERGAISSDEKGDDTRIKGLKEFLSGISGNLIESVKALSMNNIVRVSFLEPDSSAGHRCH
ncbi:MAG: hypothetical protein A2481_02670 [Candidatus Yonathbacteria bacterium RIFOXYC2_FULL_47_9]|nr:MAG: hypothetical protein A2481_02670 [Candidatus Yonathbacteria bacterium RIFOXYC2_FULL_47_9]HAT68332.1 hypothetical protein [Candidatus Yonathbacteria bacterium]